MLVESPAPRARALPRAARLRRVPIAGHGATGWRRCARYTIERRRKLKEQSTATPGDQTSSPLARPRGAARRSQRAGSDACRVAAPRRAARPMFLVNPFIALVNTIKPFSKESSSAHVPPPHFPRPLSKAIYLLWFDFLFSNSIKSNQIQSNPIKSNCPFTTLFTTYSILILLLLYYSFLI